MIFENRRQLDRAAQYLEQSRVLHGNGNNGWKKKHLDQILNVWGEFDPRTSVPTMTQLRAGGLRSTSAFATAAESISRPMRFFSTNS